MIELTQGEIADRISILELKRANGLESPELERLREHYVGHPDDLEELRIINKRAWVVVERLNTFLYDLGPYSNDAVLDDFRRAHLYNRERVEIKNRINAEFNQSIERKTWPSFSTTS